MAVSPTSSWTPVIKNSLLVLLKKLLFPTAIVLLAGLPQVVLSDVPPLKSEPVTKSVSLTEKNYHYLILNQHILFAAG